MRFRTPIRRVEYETTHSTPPELFSSNLIDRECRGDGTTHVVVVDDQVVVGGLGKQLRRGVLSRRARSCLQCTMTLRANRPLPAVSSAVPCSMGVSRNRAASSRSSGQAESAMAIFC